MNITTSIGAFRRQNVYQFDSSGASSPLQRESFEQSRWLEERIYGLVNLAARHDNGRHDLNLQEGRVVLSRESGQSKNLRNTHDLVYDPESGEIESYEGQIWEKDHDLNKLVIYRVTRESGSSGPVTLSRQVGHLGGTREAWSLTGDGSGARKLTHEQPAFGSLPEQYNLDRVTFSVLTGAFMGAVPVLGGLGLAGVAASGLKDSLANPETTKQERFLLGGLGVAGLVSGGLWLATIARTGITSLGTLPFLASLGLGALTYGLTEHTSEMVKVRRHQQVPASFDPAQS